MNSVSAVTSTATSPIMTYKTGRHVSNMHPYVKPSNSFISTITNSISSIASSYPLLFFLGIAIAVSLLIFSIYKFFSGLETEEEKQAAEAAKLAEEAIKAEEARIEEEAKKTKEAEEKAREALLGRCRQCAGKVLGFGKSFGSKCLYVSKEAICKLIKYAPEVSTIIILGQLAYLGYTTSNVTSAINNNSTSQKLPPTK